MSKYKYNDKFFEEDNEKSFYWAGFIAADGCNFISKKGCRSLHISLAEKDLQHIFLFKKHIEFDGKIFSSTSKHSLTNPNWKDTNKNTISIYSKKLCNDILRFNIVPRKTLIYTFPKWIAEHPLVNHFMRGYVDGDGSFMIDNSRPRICFELRGTKEFLEVFNNILKTTGGVQSETKVTTPDSTSKIKYGGIEAVKQITEFLYKDATVYLQRKYDIAIQSFEKITKRKPKIKV